MSNVIGHATLNVVPSTKGFGKALSSELGPIGNAGGRNLGGKVGGGFKAAVGPLLAAAGAVAMGAFIGSAIKAAGGLEQSIGAIDTVFKGSSGQMHAWATGAATAVGLTRDEYNGLGVLIGSQLKNAGTAMDELAPKTNDLITAGADMASMFGGTTKEAVEAISSALKGERDPIERYGVSLKQATIDAKAAELGFTKVGATFDQQAQAAATLALIMEQTADAHGNFAKESSTYEGTMQRLNASWGNIVATIGQGFLPVATAGGSILLGMMPAVQGLADKWAALAPAIQGVTEILLKGNFDPALFAGISGIAEDSAVIDFLFDLREGVMGLFSAFASGDPAAISTAMTGFFDSLLAARGALIEGIVGALPAIAEALAMAAPAILQGAVSAFTGLVNAVAVVLPELLAAIVTMLPSVIATLTGLIPLLLDAAVQLFQAVVEAVPVVVPPLIAAIVDLIPTIVSTVVGLVPLLVEGAIELFTALVDAIPVIVPQLVQGVVDLLPELVGAVVSLVPQLIEGAIELFTALVEAIPIILPELLGAVIELVPQIVSSLVSLIPVLITGAVRLFTGIVEALPVMLPELLGKLAELGPEMAAALADLIPTLLQAGVDLIGGLIAGLWDMAGAVVTALTNIIGQGVDAFKSFLGIHSPSRLFAEFGKHIGGGLVKGLNGSQESIAKATEGLAQKVTDTFQKITDARANAEGKLASLEDSLAKQLRANVEARERAAERVQDSERKLAEQRRKAASLAKAAAKAAKEATDEEGREAAKKAAQAAKEASKKADEMARSLDRQKKDAAIAARNAREKVDAIRDQIAEQKKLIAENDKALKSGAKEAALKAIQATDKRLQQAAAAREKIAEQLATARDKLEDALALRDGFNQSITQGVLGAFNVANHNTLPGLTDSIREQIDKAREATDVLAQLRKLGLNDTSYKQLAEGFASSGDLTAAKALLEGGKGAVTELNGLQSDLQKVAEGLGTSTSKALYQAGVDAAEGLVKGLEAKEAALTGLMEKLADSLVDTLKKKLGIKSPSRIFKGLGVHIGEGLVKGIDSMGSDVESASGALAARTIAGYEARPGLPAIQARDTASTGGGATFVTNYHDHSTSQEDKTAKLNRAQSNLQASVAAGRWR